MEEKFVTPNFQFPLCCLRFLDVESIYDKIIRFSIYKYALFLKDKDDKEYSGILNYYENGSEIEDYVDENKIKNFIPSNSFHKYLVISCLKLNIISRNIKLIIDDYYSLQNLISEYEGRNGNDVKVNIHRDMVFDIRDNKIDVNLFRVYCAIKAILGRKDFKRITIERIKYAMWGFKSKKAFNDEYFYFENELDDGDDFNFPVPLTDRQIRTIIDKLRVKNLIDKHTYRRRSTYFTAKPNLRGDKFAEKIADFLADIKINKNNHKIQSLKIEALIEKKYNKKLSNRLSIE